MTPSLRYKLLRSLQGKLGVWPTEQQLDQWIEHLASIGVQIGEKAK